MYDGQGINPASVKFKDSHEGALRHLDSSDLAHPLLSLLLLLKKLSLTRDVTSVTFCSHILADSLDSLSGDDLRSDGSLDRDVELLARYELLELLAHLASEIICMIGMDEGRKGIGRISVEKDVQLDQLGLLEAYDMVVE